MGMPTRPKLLDQHRRLANGDLESHAMRMFLWTMVVPGSPAVVVGLDMCTITITSMGSYLSLVLYTKMC
jgi:hypothetical protein